MADEPISPQKLIDDAAKALDQTPVPLTPDMPKDVPPVAPPPAPILETSVVENTKPMESITQEQPKTEIPPAPPIIPVTEPLVPEVKPQGMPSVPDVTVPPPPMPEPMIVPTAEKVEQKNKPSSEQPKTEKKKSGKGVLIATLLFFIFTLPIAIYYITQSPQFAELRSRATTVASCGKNPAYSSNPQCSTVNCGTFFTQANCAKNACCLWSNAATPTPTPTGCRNSGTQYSCTGTCPGDTKCIVIGASSCTCSVPTPAPCGQTGTANAPKCGGTCPSGQTCTLTGQASCMCTGQTATPTKPPASPTGGGLSGCTGIKNYSPSQPSQSCNIGNLNGSLSTFYGYCVFFHCPDGCTGGCGENTPGVWWEFGACNSGKLASNECGQQDTIAGDLSQGAPGQYCIPKAGCDALIQCSPSCVGVPKVTNTPGATNTPRPTNTPVPTNTPTTVATATPTDVPATPEPGRCDASCDSDSNCESGLSCVTASGVKRCRESACPTESDCSCPGATATPTTRYIAGNTPTPTRARLIAEVPTTTPTEQPTPKIPVAGVGPGILGAITVIGSVLLLVIGLIL